MPTIRIDDEVYLYLKSRATPFEDSPNSVLRRELGIEKERADHYGHQTATDSISPEPPYRVEWRAPRMNRRRPPLARGSELIRRWNIPAVQAMFHRDGNYYQHLKRFPGALCDREGYVVFQTESAYSRSPYLRQGQQLHVSDVSKGISRIPGYERVAEPLRIPEDSTSDRPGDGDQESRLSGAESAELDKYSTKGTVRRETFQESGRRS